jgi:phospholipid transport system substrate-binding protein
MKKNFLKSICILLITFFISPLCFAAQTPTEQLQAVANKMISQLEANKTQLNNMNVIRRIVNQVLIPNIDLERMSASVVGNYWRTATPEQKSTFESEFSYLVTTTYASALSSYNNDKVIFPPSRQDASSATSRVNSVIVRANGQRIPITYDVVRHGDSWKVYDFSIEHISMVQSYRSQFADVLQSGGLPALLARLKNHNNASK